MAKILPQFLAGIGKLPYAAMLFDVFVEGTHGGASASLAF
jgi:hypothetical protein